VAEAASVRKDAGSTNKNDDNNDERKEQKAERHMQQRDHVWQHSGINSSSMLLSQPTDDHQAALCGNTEATSAST